MANHGNHCNDISCHNCYIPHTTAPIHVFKNVAPKLVPFTKFVCIYFVAWTPYENPNLYAAIIKCLPILALFAFVCLQHTTNYEESKYRYCVLLGLLLSCVGDFLLIWEELFGYGVCFFGCAHIAYICGFGWLEPFNVRLGIGIYALGILTYLLVLPVLPQVVAIVTGLYCITISTAAWRAVARVEFTWEIWKWTKLFAAIGTVLFCISDTMIVFSMFRGWSLPGNFQRGIVMSTYYTAQLGIALSAVNHQKLLMESLALQKPRTD
ncbi:uncharacterized protein TRIADDRAFT_57975 [Trichoplax adhaerens]|uniref:lysoplasmalogenase n=1 Tax=Trichoplax adhaerens TaxID=10228 RepID=B3S2C7_TRIAD|nr:hypothetical protein TRIADDRAFT_57975 [Trichoplax adhaerens]EDV23075.1 hypothetical protein TRIADDRAFT_57975 [Trichoplax adhaerens]|eukprot:XP_002113985.1 hypothetical protein TRIADDRAFT_57975 [Trichoplax adhaerens]